MTASPLLFRCDRMVARVFALVFLMSASVPHSLDGANCNVTSVGLTPLTELGTGSYLGMQGGLYPGGVNTAPTAHAAAALSRGQGIGPLDAAGNPSANGKYVLLALGPSLATQEFSAFAPLANNTAGRDSRLVTVDGAQEGQAASDIVNPNAGFWSVVQGRLTSAGVTANQVTVVWLKEANFVTGGTQSAYRTQMQTDLEGIVRLLRTKYPNLQLVYMSSRSYGGYDTTGYNPEPYAYQTGFVNKAVIAKQISGDLALNFDPARGAVVAPLLLWGPYFWADGTRPRNDGLSWPCSDFESDGLHPGPAGEAKVANLLLNFFKTDASAKEWFLASTSVSPSVAITLPNGSENFIAPAAITITANASDPDGTVTRVEFFAGATKVGEDTTAPYAFTWSGVAAGTHLLTARATDNTGNSATSGVVPVTVGTSGGGGGNANVPPSVSITSPANNTSYAAPASVTVNASASDSGGSVAQVQFYSNGSLLSTDTTAPYAYSVSGVTAGTYVVTAVATDNQGATTTSAAVTIVVGTSGGTAPAPTGNTPPTSTITSPANGATYAAGATVTINVSASDPGGRVARVEFFRGTSRLGQDSFAPYRYTWSNVAAGTYVLTARATDSGGATTTSAPITIVVGAPSNTPPTVALTSPANNVSATAPASFTIAATAADTGGSITNVEFFAGATKLGEDNTSPYQITWSGVTPGTYVLTARATDNAGASTTSASRTVIVNAPTNLAPTVALVSPASGTTFSSGTGIAMSASASDADGGVGNVEFFAGATKLGEDTTAPYAFTWTGAPVGTHVLTARATDNTGATTVSSPAVVTVNGAAPAPSPTGVEVWLEAECMLVGSRWNTIADANASNGSYVQIASGTNSTTGAPGATSGWLTWVVSVGEGGAFKLWGRVIAPTLNDDSFWVRVDNGPWVQWNNIARGSTWHWDEVHNASAGNQVMTYNLTAGEHLIDIAYREDGTRLDKLYLTNTGKTPAGLGGAAGNCD